MSKTHIGAATLTALLSVGMLAGIMKADPADRGDSAFKDWTGFYTLARAKDLAGTGFKAIAPDYDLDKLIVAHLQPWAKAKMQATDGEADDTGAVCKADGVFRFPPFAGRFLWLPAPGKIVVVYGEINTAGVRRIYLDREHPKNLLPTWNGDSIGHWEGDTLVVDSAGFNSKSWLMSAMEPHTEEAHLIERMRRVSSGDKVFIEVVSVVEDRQALTSAYTFTRYYRKVDSEMPENICNEEAGGVEGIPEQRAQAADAAGGRGEVGRAEIEYLLDFFRRFDRLRFIRCGADRTRSSGAAGYRRRLSAGVEHHDASRRLEKQRFHERSSAHACGCSTDEVGQFERRCV